MRRFPILAIFVFFAGCLSEDPETSELSQSVLTAPTDAIPTPGDFDGDGCRDMALKGSNGIWYIDLCANGFGAIWDAALSGYGDSTMVPVAADYDGDGKTDLAGKYANGMWGIDFASNGYGSYDFSAYGYGDSAELPANADYDGDGKADIAIKTASGYWDIDYAWNGFGTWDSEYGGYGDSSFVPVPADYDGDHSADISVKGSNGCWYIDYRSDGFGAWNEIHCGYGNSTAVPYPADYDNDGKADMSVKDSGGTWYVDYAVGGFGAWNAIYGGRGGTAAKAVPGDYNHDGFTDLAAKRTDNGIWYVDYYSGGFGSWDVMQSTTAANRTAVDTAKPYILSTNIYGDPDTYGGTGLIPLANNTATLTIGERMVVDVQVAAGTNPAYKFAGIEVDPALNVPASLNVVNRVGSTYWDITSTTHRRFAMTCSQPGNFPLGFWLRNTYVYQGGIGFNPDGGIRINCIASQAGLYGQVTERRTNAYGVLVEGYPIAGVTVSVSGYPSATTAADGTWSLPATGGPRTITFSKGTQYSTAVAVNVNIPAGSGVRVDVPLERYFPDLVAAGLTYTTYVDYSRGKTYFHTVRVHATNSITRVGRANSTLMTDSGLCGGNPHAGFEQLLGTAQLRLTSPLAVINGLWWDFCGRDDGNGGNQYGIDSGNPLGYLFPYDLNQPSEACYQKSGFCALDRQYYQEPGKPSAAVLTPAGTYPMFTVVGSGINQQYGIVQSNANFLESPSTQWSQTYDGVPLWDVSPRDGYSDVAYALQISNPPLIWQSNVVAGGDFVWDSRGYYDWAWPRTAVGVQSSTNTLYLAVADGENVWGGNGATAHQMGRFMRDQLGCDSAMALDSGNSAQMILKGPGSMPSAMVRLNNPTGEDSSVQVNPYTELGYNDSIYGGTGSVQSYIWVGAP